MRGLRGRAGDGYGAPSRGQIHRTSIQVCRYLEQVSLVPWIRTLGPRQGCMGELGPPLGLGSEEPGKAHGPFPPALLLGPLPGPALPCLDSIPIPSAHSSILPIHPSTHPHPNTINPWTDPWDHDASLPLPAYSTVHPSTQTARVPLFFPLCPPPPWNPSVSVAKLERRGLASILPHSNPYMP